ncbi:TetR/AcrR family transcriptional regulator [Herbidospora galbida]|uniref:TetR/AcrR family transcriptional regulator n=1 Tax=Herbidospora galbida TaxID=2575442 RepID=A0A4U3MJU2_9ACTN|nr:TetR/AcrR family transcriptional regulator [Herbidospora galbida]TKK88852.1 TetR/AcrR family transcriptional regulator [Herbidospora galbida]
MADRLRADAKANQDLVLAAARRAFARDGGADASLREIAKEAGVGIGTLYRRFPTREDLVWAVYSGEVDRICEEAETSAPHPRAWMETFLDFLAAKRAMADALKVVLAGDEERRLAVRARITGALGSLLDTAAAEGAIRDDVAALDVLMALGGISLIAGEPDQRAQAGRLLDLLMDGLRPCR